VTEPRIKSRTVEIKLPHLYTEDRGHDLLVKGLPYSLDNLHGLGFTCRANWESGNVIIGHKVKGSETTIFLTVEELERFALQALALVEYRREKGIYPRTVESTSEVTA
jgi:hypothetical protein